MQDFFSPRAARQTAPAFPLGLGHARGYSLFCLVAKTSALHGESAGSNPASRTFLFAAEKPRQAVPNPGRSADRSYWCLLIPLGLTAVQTPDTVVVSTEVAVPVGPGFGPLWGWFFKSAENRKKLRKISKVSIQIFSPKFDFCFWLEITKNFGWFQGPGGMGGVEMDCKTRPRKSEPHRV